MSSETMVFHGNMLQRYSKKFKNEALKIQKKEFSKTQGLLPTKCNIFLT
jgi:hypothetical protein